MSLKKIYFGILIAVYRHQIYSRKSRYFAVHDRRLENFRAGAGLRFCFQQSQILLADDARLLFCDFNGGTGLLFQRQGRALHHLSARFLLPGRSLYRRLSASDRQAQVVFKKLLTFGAVLGTN